MKDETLLENIAHGDPQALAVLYDRYSRMVYSLAYRILQDDARAEEVIQDVFLSVWKKSVSYDNGRGRFSTWLSQVTRNRSIDILRRQQVRPEGNSLALDEVFQGMADDNQLVEPSVVSMERSDQIFKALKELPEEQWKPIALAYFYGLTQSQIAGVLDEPLGTTKTRIRLGMQKLREKLEKLF